MPAAATRHIDGTIANGASRRRDQLVALIAKGDQHRIAVAGDAWLSALDTLISPEDAIARAHRSRCPHGWRRGAPSNHRQPRRVEVAEARQRLRVWMPGMNRYRNYFQFPCVFAAEPSHTRTGARSNSGSVLHNEARTRSADRPDGPAVQR